MPPITRTIPFGEQSDDVTAIQKGLLTLGAQEFGGELFTPTEDGLFESNTIVELKKVINRFAGPETLGEPFNASWGRLLHVAVAEIGRASCRERVEISE